MSEQKSPPAARFVPTLTDIIDARQSRSPQAGGPATEPGRAAPGQSGTGMAGAPAHQGMPGISERAAGRPRQAAWLSLQDLDEAVGLTPQHPPEPAPAQTPHARHDEVFSPLLRHAAGLADGQSEPAAQQHWARPWSEEFEQRLQQRVAQRLDAVLARQVQTVLAPLIEQQNRELLAQMHQMMEQALHEVLPATVREMAAEAAASASEPRSRLFERN